MHKYALYARICIRINMPLCKFKLEYASIAYNLYKYAKICSDPISISHMHSYAFICTKYAKICKICKHESCMQHMQKYALATLLMTTARCVCMLVAPLRCDLGCCSRTVVVIKAAVNRRGLLTSIFAAARHQPVPASLFAGG